MRGIETVRRQTAREQRLGEMFAEALRRVINLHNGEVEPDAWTLRRVQREFRVMQFCAMALERQRRAWRRREARSVDALVGQLGHFVKQLLGSLQCECDECLLERENIAAARRRCDHEGPREATSGLGAGICGDCGEVVGRRHFTLLQQAARANRGYGN